MKQVGRPTTKHRYAAIGWALVQAVLLALVEQGLAADAEDFGGLGDFVARGLERGADGFLLDILERAQRRSGTARAEARGAHALGEILRAQNGALGKDQGSLE